jgi:hypothetical protein
MEAVQVATASAHKMVGFMIVNSLGFFRSAPPRSSTQQKIAKRFEIELNLPAFLLPFHVAVRRCWPKLCENAMR